MARERQATPIVAPTVDSLDTDRGVADTDAVLKPHRPEKTGRPANLPRLKLADLLAQEPDTKGSDDAVNIAPFRRHRPEKVGRPATLSRVKLADLLAQEPDHTESEEIDTGPAVGHEVW